MQRAEELSQQLKKQKLAFDKVIPCNIGNPQAVGQSPITYHRQILACLTDPSLIDKDVYPADVCEKAAQYVKGVTDGKMGAYSHSKGHAVFRDDVAAFYTARDGIPTSIEDMFLTDGASAGVKTVLQLCVDGPQDGVMVPIPQYPLYTATMSLLGGQSVGYFLDEESGWGVTTEELERSIKQFRAEGGRPKAIAVINPGNPTGGVMSRDAIEGVLRFAERERLVVMADEVYQDNIHVDTKKFVSFRKVAAEIGSKVEVFSFHSCSKGVIGECGLRGGVVHCMNVDPAVMDQLYKLASISLCGNTIGQALMASILTPPPINGPSRALFDAEKEGIRSALKRKAKMVTQRLNAMDGISCQPIEGAMYAFPKVQIEGDILKKAIAQGKPADAVYCLEMVDRTGIVTVPGSGFGQKPGEFHFRLTILPQEEDLPQVLDSLEIFHNEHAR